MTELFFSIFLSLTEMATGLALIVGMAKSN